MKNTMIINKNTVSATYLPYAAYKSALALATAHKGEIGKTDKGNFKATFANAKTAEKFVKAWTAEYDANRKPTPVPAQKAKPAPVKGKAKAEDIYMLDGKEYTLKATSDGCVLVPVDAPKKAEPRKARKAKGNGIDFTQFKGTKSEKNRALHAMLVSKGIADSRTKEYQAVWNARPWAK